MEKKKKRKGGSTPRRKRYNRKDRLANANKWLQTYNGKNIVKGYAKHFGVDKLCAVQELERLGYSYSDKYKQHLKDEQVRKAEERRERKRKREADLIEPIFDSDDYFARIIDYTDSGVPIGLTWEQWEALEGEEDEPVSDDVYYDHLLYDSLEKIDNDLSLFDGENIMVIDANDHDEEPHQPDLDKLFELFIQWESGNISSEQMQEVLAEEVGGNYIF